MIFDTHSHCYWDTMLPRIDEIVANMRQNGVAQAVQIGCDIETSRQAIGLAGRFPRVFYATVGLHPETAQDIPFVVTQKIQNSHYQDSETCGPHEIYDSMKDLIEKNRDLVVAIGEAGLDYYHLSSDPEVANFQKISQENWFIKQWELAQEYKLPLVIHTRNARNETLDFIIKNNINRAVIHCYSEDSEFARALLDFSSEIYFAFGGILTYKKSESVQETAKILPLDRILLETDAPFLSPQAVRGTINEPANTRYVLDKLCELRMESREVIEQTIYENSLRFYGIKV